MQGIISDQCLWRLGGGKETLNCLASSTRPWLTPSELPHISLIQLGLFNPPQFVNGCGKYRQLLTAEAIPEIANSQGLCVHSTLSSQRNKVVSNRESGCHVSVCTTGWLCSMYRRKSGIDIRWSVRQSVTETGYIFTSPLPSSQKQRKTEFPN